VLVVRHPQRWFGQCDSQRYRHISGKGRQTRCEAKHGKEDRVQQDDRRQGQLEHIKPETKVKPESRPTRACACRRIAGLECFCFAVPRQSRNFRSDQHRDHGRDHADDHFSPGSLTCTLSIE